MKKLFLALLSVALASALQMPVLAQQTAGAIIVTACGTAPFTYTAGQTQPIVQDINGTLCTTAGGGGGGGAVTIANGADVAEGNTADAASSAGGTGTLSAKLRLMTTQLGTLNTTLGSPFQAGGSIGNTTFAATQATASSLNAQVVGNVADAGAIAGNPLKMGCVNLTSLPIYTDGQQTTCQADVRGSIRTTINFSGVNVGFLPLADNADDVVASATVNKLAVMARLSLFDGANYDRWYGDSTNGAFVNVKSSVALSVNPGTSTSWGLYNQGTSLVGQAGVLSWSVATTGAPTYTNSQMNPLSLQLDGSLRAAVTNTVTVTGTVTTTPPSNASTNIAQINGQTPLMGNGVTGTGSLRVTLASDNTANSNPWLVNPGTAASWGVAATAAAVPANAIYNGMNVAGNLVGLTGTGTNLNVNCAAGCSGGTADTAYTPTSVSSATSFTRVDLNGFNALTFQFITSVGAGNTITPEDSDDDTNYLTTTIYKKNPTGALADQISAGFSPALATAYYYPKKARYFRLRVSTYGSGTLSLVGTQTVAPATITPTVFITNGGSLSATIVGPINPVSTMNSASANSGLTAAAALVFDDVAPTAITENQFGFQRMSANRNAYATLRDAAGNERGQNVNANNAAMVAIDQTTPGTTNGVSIASGLGTGYVYTTSITRPADTAIYAANDALSNSTSAPTAGGFTFSNACRASGSSGIITDAVIISTNAPGTTLQGEIWIFDQAVTAINDNAAFALSDADALFYLGKIPFTLAVEAVNNSTAAVAGINMTYTCVGTANLRYLVKVINAYTPANAEVVSVRLKGQYLNYFLIGLGGLSLRRRRHDNDDDGTERHEAA